MCEEIEIHGYVVCLCIFFDKAVGFIFADKPENVAVLLDFNGDAAVMDVEVGDKCVECTQSYLNGCACVHMCVHVCTCVRVYMYMHMCVCLF